MPRGTRQPPSRSPLAGGVSVGAAPAASDRAAAGVVRDTLTSLALRLDVAAAPTVDEVPGPSRIRLTPAAARRRSRAARAASAPDPTFPPNPIKENRHAPSPPPRPSDRRPAA